MSDQISLEIPDAVLKQARTEALMSNRTVEAVLVEWLARGVPPNPTYMIYTPFGMDAAVRPMLDALAADNPNDKPSET